MQASSTKNWGTIQTGEQGFTRLNNDRIAILNGNLNKEICQIIPGALEWKEVCEDFPFERTEFYNEPVQKVYNRTKDNCQQITQPHCHNYTIPTFMVINETKTDKVYLTP